jgi:hypothetical protein
MPSTLDLGGAVQSFGRLLWLSHGVFVVLIVGSLLLSVDTPDRARLSPLDDRMVINEAGIIAATSDRTGPTANVKPVGYIVCTQREVREARADTPRWTSAYIALVGASPPEYIDKLRALGASGEIQLYDYECP